jgi:hypothetical protein
MSFFTGVRFLFDNVGIGARSTSLDSGNPGSRVNIWRAINVVTKEKRKRSLFQFSKQKYLTIIFFLFLDFFCNSTD